MQQQRFAAALQRQVQEQMLAQQQIAANARDIPRQFPSSASNNSIQSTGSESTFNQASQNSNQENYSGGFSQQNRTGSTGSSNQNSELPSQVYIYFLHKKYISVISSNHYLEHCCLQFLKKREYLRKICETIPSFPFS